MDKLLQAYLDKRKERKEASKRVRQEIWNDGSPLNRFAMELDRFENALAEVDYQARKRLNKQ